MLKDAKNEIGIFIGRFQPFHLGHKQVIDTIIGSGRRPYVLTPNITKFGRDPFNFLQKKEMIESVYDRPAFKPVILPINSKYEYLGPDEKLHYKFDVSNWRNEIFEKINQLEPNAKKYLYYGVRLNKYRLVFDDKDIDATSTETLCEPYSQFAHGVEVTLDICSATNIRKKMIQHNGQLKDDAKGVLPESVFKYLNENCKNTLRTLYAHYSGKEFFQKGG